MIKETHPVNSENKRGRPMAETAKNRGLDYILVNMVANILW